MLTANRPHACAAALAWLLLCSAAFAGNPTERVPASEPATTRPWSAQDVPDLRPPLKPTYTRSSDEPVTILQPAQPKTGRAAIAFIFRGKRVEAWEPATGAVRWSTDLGDPSRPELLMTDQDGLLLATPFSVLSLDSRTGRAQWDFGRAPPPDAVTLRDPEFLPQVAAAALSASRVLVTTDRRAATLLNLEDGHVVWERKLDTHFSGPPAMNDRHVVYTGICNGHTCFVLLDAITGQELRTIPRDDARQVTRLQLLPNGDALAAGADWLACYAPQAGRSRWAHHLEAGLRASEIVLDLQSVYVPLADGSLAAYDLRDGNRRWRRDLEKGDAAHFLAVLPPETGRQPAGGGLLVAGGSGISELDIATGEPRWRCDLPSELADIRLTRDFLIALTRLSPTTSTTTTAWEHQQRLCFISIQTGERTPDCLDPGPGTIDDWAVYDHALLLRRGSAIAAWSDAPTSQPTH